MGLDQSTVPDHSVKPPLRPAKDAPFAEWRDWAWHVGMFAASNRATYTNGCDKYITIMAKSSGRSDEEIASLLESGRTAYRRCRKPTNAPELAADCVRWFESRWGCVRLVDGRIGRSAVYPKLLMLAYCLGRDGKPFAFADSRIGRVAGCNANTVRLFMGRMLQMGLIIEVRGGVKGTKGVAAWYRLENAEEIGKMIGVDLPSPIRADNGLTFRQYIATALPF